MIKFFRKSKELRSEGKIIIKSKIKIKHLKVVKNPEVLEGSHTKCANCKDTVSREAVVNALYSCPKCHYLFRMNPKERISITFDTFKELYKNINQPNPLKLDFYKEKLDTVSESSGENSAVTTGIGTIEDQKTAVFIMNHEFIMGSMGVVVGEKLTQLFRYARNQKLPVVGFISSGGARMQEGMHSLMQMAKTSAEIAKFDYKGGLYIPILVSPTYGGVTASFGMLGDIIIAEEKASIGFAGKQVIKNAMKQDLPDGFQTAEFLLEKGFIDIVSSRVNIKNCLYKLLKMHTNNKGGK